MVQGVVIAGITILFRKCLKQKVGCKLLYLNTNNLVGRKIEIYNITIQINKPES